MRWGAESDIYTSIVNEDRKSITAYCIRSGSVWLGRIGLWLFLGLIISYAIAAWAVHRGTLSVIRVQMFDKQFNTYGQGRWPEWAPAEWPNPTRVASSSNWGLLWTEWSNDEEGLDQGMAHEMIQELRAGWPIRCLKWQEVRWINPQVLGWTPPTLERVWQHPSWGGRPLAAFLGYSGGLIPRILPLDPLPLRLFANAALWATALWLVLAAPLHLVRRLRRRYRTRHAQCVSCGYPRGISARCTECGQRID